MLPLATSAHLPISVGMNAIANQPLAVLCSGGLDSAILLAEALHHCPAVHPLYVRFGLAWEEVEMSHLRRFLVAVAHPSLRPLVVLQQPVTDLYGKHWSLTGQNVPDAQSPDEAVFLPGRNVLLLAKTMLWCHLHDVPQLALAPLGSNPFPDATPGVLSGLLGGRQSVGRRCCPGTAALRRPAQDRRAASRSQAATATHPFRASAPSTVSTAVCVTSVPSGKKVSARLV
jgi:hypothetical protein